MLRDTIVRKYNAGYQDTYTTKYCKNGTVLYRCRVCNKFYSNGTKLLLSKRGHLRFYGCPHCGTEMNSSWN